MSTTGTDDVRDSLHEDVLLLRRRGALTPLPSGVALLAALVLAIVGGDETGYVWGGLLAVGPLVWIVAVRQGRRRDAVVLAQSDDAVRSYVRGRISALLGRGRTWPLAIVSTLILLLGVPFLVGGTREPARPMLAAQVMLFSGSILGTLAWRRFVARPRLVRRLGDLGGRPESVAAEAWLAAAAREIAATQGLDQAALLWYETTGVSIRDAKAAVARLPAAGPEAVPSGPPADVVRDRVRALVRRDLVGTAYTLAVLATLVAIENWAHGVTVHAFAQRSFGDLTLAQRVYVAIGVLVVVVAPLQWRTHRDALKGGDAATLAHLRNQLDRRLAQVSRWSKLDLALVAIAALFVVEAVVALVAAQGRGAPVPWRRLAEAGVFALWLAVLPWLARKRRRPVLARLRAEMGEPLPAQR